jgi:hypothetical protein
VATEWARECRHKAAGMTSVEIRLANPNEICWVQCTCGRGGRRADVCMCYIVSETEDDCIPVVKAVDDVGDSRGNLTGEVGKFRSEAMDDQQAKKRLGDGLTKAA